MIGDSVVGSICILALPWTDVSSADHVRNLADAAILYTLQMAAKSPDLILKQSPIQEMITVEENPLASTPLYPYPPH